MLRVFTMASCVALFALAAFGNPPAKPAPAAASQATTQSAGLPDTLLHDEYTFTDPPVGYVVSRLPDDTVIQFTKEHQGAFKIGFQPKEMEIQADTAGSIGMQMVAAIKKQRAADKVEVIMAPKIEKDKRFQIVIHEKFKVGSESLDTEHIFTTIGPRVLEMTISSISPDTQVTDSLFDDAKSLFAGMKFDKKAFLKQKKIDDQAKLKH